MEFINVIAAAAAAYGFGALWYMLLARSWIAESGVAVDSDGKPANGSNPLPYITAFASALLVAGMMRHIFSLGGIQTPGAGFVAGVGIGLFLASPWLVTCYTFNGRTFRLIMIDTGFASLSCAIIGLVLALF